MESITCDEALRALSRAIDGQAVDDAPRLEEHLRDCAACRAEAEAWRGLADLMARWGPPTPRRSAKDVARAVASRSAPRQIGIGIAAAVLCGIAVGGTLGLSATPSRTDAETVLKEALRVDGAHSLERAFLAAGGGS